jgi:hypothetical protein
MSDNLAVSVCVALEKGRNSIVQKQDKVKELFETDNCLLTGARTFVIGRYFPV